MVSIVMIFYIYSYLHIVSTQRTLFIFTYLALEQRRWESIHTFSLHNIYIRI